MAKTSFAQAWQEIRDEARAEGPAAVAELERMQHRYRIGAQIAIVRKRRGITQDQLSSLAGVDQGDISRIEHGQLNATEDTLAAIARALGHELTLVPSDDLVAV